MGLYRQPGVTIKIVDNPGTALLPSGLRIPCIVATGLTTTKTPNIAVTRGAGTTDTITGYVSGEVASVYDVGDFPDLVQYKENTDWRQVDHQIVWIAGQQAPTTASVYYASIREPKVSTLYNSGVLYTDIQAVRNDFGDEIINGVLTAITTAAKLCFDNGAAGIVLIQPTSGSQTHLQDAIDAAKREDLDILVVPQACNTTLDNYVKAHVLTQSSPAVRHERVWFRSGDGMSDAVTTLQAAAVGMHDERVTVMAPPSFVATFRDATVQADQDLLLPSSYLAAAYAGVCANPNYDAATPLTRKSLIGIKSLSTHNYTVVDKDNLGGSGITVVELVNGEFRIRHAITTDTTNTSRITQSVVFIKDNIRKELRTLLDATFIGTKADNSATSRITGVIEAFLRAKVRDEIITAFRNIKVQQSTSDPRTFNITFDIAPLYPVEYIDVVISLVTA